MEKKMKIKLWISFLLLASVLMAFACSKKKEFSGEYRGEATAKLEPNYPNSPLIAEAKNQDAVATVKQDGDNVTLEVSNSDILKNCQLKGKVNPNGKVYVSGSTCDVSVSGVARSAYFSEGSVSLGETDGSLTIELTGLAGTGERFKYKFQGKKK